MLKNIYITLILTSAFIALTVIAIKQNTDKLQHSLSFSSAENIEYALFNAERTFRMLRNPKTNTIPGDIRIREARFVSTLPSKEDVFYSRKSNALQMQEWSSQGPLNVAGRMKCLEFNNSNAQVILAGAASGGIWKSINSGNSWYKTSSPMDNPNITCLLQDKRPGHENIWYAGTGELLSTTNRKIATFPRTLGMGNGIMKSTDGGESWEVLESTISDDVHLRSAFQGVWRLVQHPDDEQGTIYAACYSGILKSDNGGDTWEMLLGDSEVPAFCTDLAIDKNGRFYAASGGNFGGKISGYTPEDKAPKYFGIWYSEDGKNWADITPDNFPHQNYPRSFRTVKMALSTENQELYVLTESPASSPDDVSLSFSASQHTLWHLEGISKSGYPDWEDLTDNLPYHGYSEYPSDGYNTLGGYTMSINFKPDDDDVLFISGTCLFRSMNAFADSSTVAQIGGYPYRFEADSLHPDIHNVAFSPENNFHMYTASDGGIHKTDFCTMPRPLYINKNKGLVTTQFYSINMDPEGFKDGVLFGGLQDNASLLSYTGDPADDWITVYGGDGMSSYVSKGKKFIIGSIYNGRIFSVDLVNGILLGQLPNQLSQAYEFNFFTNFVVDPLTENTLYLPAANKILRKDNFLASIEDYQKVRDDWYEILELDLPESVSVTAISISENPANVLFCGTDDGRVFKITNANSNPALTEITDANFPAGGFVSSIDIDPDDADNIIVSFSNYELLSIFNSSDGGFSWESSAGNLEEFPDGSGAGPSVRYVKSLHLDEGTLYFAATGSGLYSTVELKGSETVWTLEGENTIGHSIVDYISARETDGKVAIATQGSGVYAAYAQFPNAVGNDLNSISTLEISPNPTQGAALAKINLKQGTTAELYLYDNNGRLITTVHQGFLPAGTHEFRIGKKSSGMYHLKLRCGNAGRTEKIIFL